MALPAGPEGLILELEDLLRTTKGMGLLKVGHALQLAVQAFSLAANYSQRRGMGIGVQGRVFSAAQMQQLREGLIDCILNVSSTPGTVSFSVIADMQLSSS